MGPPVHDSVGVGADAEASSADTVAAPAAAEPRSSRLPAGVAVGGGVAGAGGEPPPCAILNRVAGGPPPYAYPYGAGGGPPPYPYAYPYPYPHPYTGRAYGGGGAGVFPSPPAQGAHEHSVMSCQQTASLAGSGVEITVGQGGCLLLCLYLNKV